MRQANIPDDHHIVRHCKKKLYYLHNGKLRPYPEAFHLRAATSTMPEEDTLSGVYYEWFDGTREEKFKASYHFIFIEMKPKDALFRLNAGLIRQQGIARSKRLRVLHDQDDEKCPPYATIRGMPRPPDDELCALLTSLAVIEGLDLIQIGDQ
jgi:hypothetical protein